MSPLLTFNKLVRPQCHTLPKTGHHERVRHCEEREVLAEREVLGVEENDRLVRQRREA